MGSVDNFGEGDGVLLYVKEKSDDIEHVVIPLFKVGSLPTDGRSPVHEYEDVGLILFMVNGDTQLIHKADAERVLNDGILNRMRIDIRIWSPSDAAPS